MISDQEGGREEIELCARVLQRCALWRIGSYALARRIRAQDTRWLSSLGANGMPPTLSARPSPFDPDRPCSRLPAVTPVPVSSPVSHSCLSSSFFSRVRSHPDLIHWPVGNFHDSREILPRPHASISIHPTRDSLIRV